MATLQTIIDEINSAKQFVADAQYGTSIMAVSALKTEDRLLDIRNALMAVNGVQGTGDAIERIDAYLPLIHGTNSVHAEEISIELDKLLMDIQGSNIFEEISEAV